ncbi:unnamed protein product [Soboliphyme baturini]|uniref:Hemerythrin domain-containing protein n=1 Tax=Soboliphyme baturini TaxID=241478 RepID=A0A183IH81_9BILA|nr:unnamed protein product [Soboliphyme baturini]
MHDTVSRVRLLLPVHCEPFDSKLMGQMKTSQVQYLQLRPKLQEGEDWFEEFMAETLGVPGAHLIAADASIVGGRGVRILQLDQGQAPLGEAANLAEVLLRVVRAVMGACRRSKDWKEVYVSLMLPPRMLKRRNRKTVPLLNACMRRIEEAYDEIESKVAMDEVFIKMAFEIFELIDHSRVEEEFFSVPGISISNRFKRWEQLLKRDDFSELSSRVIFEVPITDDEVALQHKT